MPLGFANAPSCYQRAINKALGTLKDSMAQVYLDDVMVSSEPIEEGFARLEKVLQALSTAGFSLNLDKCTEPIEEGFARLEKVLQALSTAGFSLNLDKCTFFVKEVKYFGFTVEMEKLNPVHEKYKL
ncbi:Reverse transcriptase (RNA-dependent DNA polymerase) [Popillia japonica]|uniref:Reverse transcriptase (RNA-dependent DNA polymerase) n=1 Tax=Popillia japonica TaxID=7064 RepID=A0AAW1N6B4_POPJA